jgi:hypothetical protein
MNTFLCCLIWLAAALLLPALALDWATCSRAERIRRLRAMGWSRARIADHLRISRYQVSKALSA